MTGDQGRGRGALRGLFRALTSVPVVLLVLAVVGVVAFLTSSRARDWIELSFTREPDPYVELALPDGSTRAVESACQAADPSLQIVFQMTSRGVDQPRRITYVASVSPQRSPASASPSAVPSATRRTVVLPAGVRTTESAVLLTPLKPWTLRVHLVGTGQTLRVHCRTTA